ncbi:hypothetical protein OH687_27025 [Burkholderia anthina]|nr:hypothetical protein OH687_27025 [Burkholderia anthina]
MATSYGGHDTGRTGRLCSRAYRSRIPFVRAACIPTPRAVARRRTAIAMKLFVSWRTEGRSNRVL